MSVAIVSMVGAKTKRVPYCLRDQNPVTVAAGVSEAAAGGSEATTEAVTLPNVRICCYLKYHSIV